MTCAPSKKAIATAHAFAYPTSKEALSNYVARVAEKLRMQHMAAGALTVFTMTDQYRQEPQFYASRSARLLVPSSDTGELIQHALEVFRGREICSRRHGATVENHILAAFEALYHALGRIGKGAAVKQ